MALLELSVAGITSSLPATFIALVLGNWATSGDGRKTTRGKLVTAILLLAVASTLAFFALFPDVMIAVGNHDHGGGRR